MASGLPDAKIVVVLDTAKAEKDADKLRKGAKGTRAGEDATGRTIVGRRRGSTGDSVARIGVLASLKKTRSRMGAARRAVLGPLIYAAMAAAIVQTSLALGQIVEGVLKEIAKKSMIPGLEAAVEEAMKGSAWLKGQLSDLTDTVTSISPAVEQMKSLSRARAFAGAKDDSDEIAKAGWETYRVQLAEQWARNKIEAFSSKTVAEEFPKMLLDFATRGGNR